MLKHCLTHCRHNLSFLTLSMYVSVVDHSNFQPLVLYTRRNHCSFSFIRMVCLLAHITLSLTHRVFFSFFHTVNFSIPLTNTKSASKYQGIDSLTYSGAFHLYIYNQNSMYMLATYISLYWYVYTDALSPHIKFLE
jgi:hypothetical protein